MHGIILVVPSLDRVSLVTLWRYLALKEQNIDVRLMAAENTTKISTHRLVANEQFQPIVTRDSYDRVPRSKGDKHRNRRFRWT